MMVRINSKPLLAITYLSAQTANSLPRSRLPAVQPLVPVQQSLKTLRKMNWLLAVCHNATFKAGNARLKRNSASGQKLLYLKIGFANTCKAIRLKNIMNHIFKTKPLTINIVRVYQFRKSIDYQYTRIPTPIALLVDLPVYL